jgi:hypothetical protein
MDSMNEMLNVTAEEWLEEAQDKLPTEFRIAVM